MQRREREREQERRKSERVRERGDERKKETFKEKRNCEPLMGGVSLSLSLNKINKKGFI